MRTAFRAPEPLGASGQTDRDPNAALWAGAEARQAVPIRCLYGANCHRDQGGAGKSDLLT